jgi:hypothetical protein
MTTCADCGGPCRDKPIGEWQAAFWAWAKEPVCDDCMAAWQRCDECEEFTPASHARVEDDGRAYCEACVERAADAAMPGYPAAVLAGVD